jgi:hypothetical protein
METLISLHTVGDSDKDINAFWNYLLKCNIPYVSFSQTFYSISVIYMIGLTAYLYFSSQNIILLLLTALPSLVLITTRFFITKSNRKVSSNIIGFLREITHVDTTSLYLFITHIALLISAINYLYFMLLQYQPDEISIVNLIALRSISVYLILVSRIYRSAFRDDPLRSVIEVIIPELSVDFYDSCNLIILSTTTDVFQVKVIFYCICVMWNMSILIRVTYLTLIYFPYSAKGIWKHLGFVEHNYIEEITDNSMNRHIIAFKIKMLLAYFLVFIELCALGIRSYAIYLNPEHNEIIYTMLFKNVVSIYKLIISINLYRKVFKVTEPKEGIFRLGCCGIRNKFIVSLLLVISCLIIILLKVYLAILYLKMGILGNYLITVPLGFDNLILLGLMIYSVVTYKWTMLAVYTFITLSAINYPILFFNYNVLPLSGSNLLDMIFSQKGIYIIFTANIVIFYLHYLADNINKPTSSVINAKVLLANCLISSILSDCIMDYLSSLNFFLAYKFDIPLVIHITLVTLSVLEHILSGYYILAISKRTKFGVYLTQQSLADMKAKIKLFRLIFETFCFGFRLFLFIRFGEDSNIFIFKNLNRIIISIAAIERVVGRNHEIDEDGILEVRLTQHDPNIELMKRDSYIAYCKKSYEIIMNYEIENFNNFIKEMLGKPKRSFCVRIYRDVVLDLCYFFN